VGLAS